MRAMIIGALLATAGTGVGAYTAHRLQPPLPLPEPAPAPAIPPQWLQQLSALQTQVAQMQGQFAAMQQFLPLLQRIDANTQAIAGDIQARVAHERKMSSDLNTVLNEARRH